MQGQKSFFVRTIHPNRTTAADIARQSVSVEPACVQFTDYPSNKISICRLTLRNDSKMPKRIILGQPSKAYFEVKAKSRDIPPRDCTDLYVVFNPQREKGRIEDEFTIKVEGEVTVIHVPVLCQYKSGAGRGWSTKQLIAAKENEEDRGKAVRRRPPAGVIRHLSIEQRQSNNLLDFRRLSITLFQDRFDRISAYVEQKKVKNEVYLGENPPDLSARGAIIEYERKVEELARGAIGRTVENRWTAELKEEGPVVQLFSGVALGWDAARNNSELIFRNGLSKIQEEVRKLVVSLRFDKICHSLSLYRGYRAKEENKGKPLRVQEYLEYLRAHTQAHSGAAEVQLGFDRGSLRHEELPIDYQRGPAESLFRERSFRFEIAQRIGFDNWVPMSVLRPSEAELYQLAPHPFPAHHLHMPASIRDHRQGAPAELPFRTPFAPPIPSIEPLPEVELGPKAVEEGVIKRREKLYFAESDDKLCIGQDELSLGEDLDSWLERYLQKR